VPQATKRVLVVDDSAFMRRLIAEIVEFRSHFRVVGTACNGIEALEKVRDLAPDIVTLDIAMPQMDGLAALARIMDEMPRPVIVVSAAGSSDLNASAVRALELGAVDFVRKPSGPVSIDLLVVREQLLRALDTASLVSFGEPEREARVSPPRERAAPPVAERAAGRVVVIAASTGGPRALSEVVSRLPADLDAAVLIVQHMPAEFIPTLADRLGQLCSLAVSVAANGEPVRAGRVYLAPGDAQLRVRADRGSAMTEIDSGDPLSGLRPAADPLFRSAAAVFRRNVIGVVLSGMGRDGSEGLRTIRGVGGGAIVQDRASSIIYGMPSAALATAGADRVLPAQEIAGAIARLLASGRRVA
jgi:two-component system, chemotaxis family, protein-glutamate methylesterase/glutaminase